MSAQPYTLISTDREALIAAAPPSTERQAMKRVFQGEGATIIRLTFVPGQEMREHSTNAPLIVQVLAGDLRFSIAGDELELTAGSLLHVAPGEVHALKAHTEAHVLLTLCLA